MNRQELSEILEVDGWNEIAYTEQFIAMFENLDEVSEELLFEILEEMDEYALRELIEAYMDDIIVGVPEDEPNLYSLFSRVKTGLMNKVFNEMSDEKIILLAEDLRRLYEWLNGEVLVNCKDVETGKQEMHSLHEALVLARLEKLSEGKFEFEFPKGLDFEIEEEYNSDFSEDDSDDSISKGLVHGEFPVIEDMNN